MKIVTDRLGVAKEVAQVGAAIGREFSHTLLAAAAALGPAHDRRQELIHPQTAGAVARLWSESESRRKAAGALFRVRQFNRSE
jgi:predicted ATPase